MRLAARGSPGAATLRPAAVVTRPAAAALASTGCALRSRLLVLPRSRATLQLHFSVRRFSTEVGAKQKSPSLAAAVAGDEAGPGPGTAVDSGADASAAEMFKAAERAEKAEAVLEEAKLSRTMSVAEVFDTIKSDDEIMHPVFDFTEEELTENWEYLDKNGDGLLSRPRIAQLMQRLVDMQKKKLKDIVAHKAEHSVDVEAGKIPLLPRWIQWGLKETRVQIEMEIKAIDEVLEIFDADAELVDVVMDKIDGWEGSKKDKIISRASFFKAAAAGMLKEIQLEDIRQALVEKEAEAAVAAAAVAAADDDVAKGSTNKE